MNELLVTSESNPIDVRCKSLTLDGIQKFVQASVPSVVADVVELDSAVGTFQWDVPELLTTASKTITLNNALIKTGSAIFLSMGSHSNGYNLSHAVPASDGSVHVALTNITASTILANTVKITFMILQPTI